MIGGIRYRFSALQSNPIEWVGIIDLKADAIHAIYNQKIHPIKTGDLVKNRGDSPTFLLIVVYPPIIHGRRIPLFNLEKSVEHRFVENLGGKDKESLTDNGLSPYQELFCRIYRSDFSQICAANSANQMGE